MKEIEKMQQADWEIVNRQIPNGVNPHAYRLGYLKGFAKSQSISEWVSVETPPKHFNLIIHRLIKIIENADFVPDKNQTGTINAAKKLIVDNFNISDVLRSIDIKSHWINIKDKMPSENEEVLCATDYWIKTNGEEKRYSEVDKATFSTQDTLRPCFAKDNGFVLINVTHWQPLPPPPQTSK